MNMEKYHPTIRIIHWLMFVLFAINFVLGAVMIEFKECCSPWTMYDIHKSTGVLVFLFLLLRLFLRWQTPIPAPLPQIPALNHHFAQSIVYLLYLLMIIVPISGYALSNVHGHPVEFYGLPLPQLFPTRPDLEIITSFFHYYLTYVFLGLFLLHILGVILHQVRGLEILRRIT